MQFNRRAAGGSMRRAGIAAAVAVLWLAGCAPRAVVAPTPEVDKAALWRQHQANMARIIGWDVKGKIAIKSGRKGDNATLVWDYRAAEETRQEIEIYGPFGSGRVRIAAAADKAVLRDGKGPAIEGETIAEVLYRRLGWRVPFAELQYWVRGLAAPGDADLTLDDGGRLRALQQGDWRVEYDGYVAAGGVQLPAQLTAAAAPGRFKFYDKDGEYLGDTLQVKVSLRRWREVEIAP